VASSLPISIFFITRNEADRLEPALKAALQLSNDILVVDSGSDDGTQQLAERMGAKVIQNDWPGYGPQKRFAEDHCDQGWLLNLDADEVMTEELVEEIKNLFKNGEPAMPAYSIAFVEVFPGEKRPHPLAFAMTAVRLYKKSAGRYADSLVHDRVQLNKSTKVGALKAPALHYSVRSLGDQIDKLNRYTDMQVEDLTRRNKTISSWRFPFEFFLAFLKAYFIRRHCVRGLYGYMTAMNYAFSRHLRLAKHLERKRLDKDKSQN
jgi:glycosyltransferase involved in cell wall biosynthesis